MLDIYRRYVQHIHVCKAWPVRSLSLQNEGKEKKIIKMRIIKPTSTVIRWFTDNCD